MRLVVIESPYAGDIERNLRYLRACMADCLARGESPYASHALYTQPGVLDDREHEQRALGIAAGFAWRLVAEATIVYGNFGISKGMQYDIDHAELHGRPIEYRRLAGQLSTSEYRQDLNLDHKLATERWGCP